MVFRRIAACVSLAVAVGTALTSPVLAGDRDNGYRHRGSQTDISFGAGIPSIVRHNGTYAGAISALHVRGNGTYIYAEGSGRQRDAAPAPRAKIIDVTQHADSSCAYQAGVCVIRP